MTRTRVLQSSLLATLAISVAWRAQVALAGLRPSDAWALYPAAIALFGLALRDLPLLSVVRRRPDGEAPASAPSTLWRVKLFLALSLSCTSLALAAFLQVATLGLAWALHVAAILLFIAAFVPPAGAIVARLRAVRIERFVRTLLRDWGPLLVVLAVALAVRVWQNGNLPEGLMGDEALYGLAARRILHEPGFVPPAYMETIQRPPHYAYLVALAFEFFGDGASSLRLVSALFALAGIAAVWLLFNRWFGRSTHAGLSAASLLAVMRYDLTFSRIAIDGISTPFFIVLTLFFVSRGMARKQWSDFGAVGLTLGLSLQFYLPMRIFILVLGALGTSFVLAALLRDGYSTQKVRAAWRSRVRPWLPHALCVVLGLFIGSAPLAEEALREPGVVFERQSSASIFFEPEEPDLLKRVTNNTLKHLAMFNGSGDRFGRDNLPGEPMLDPLMGILCALGLGIALARRRDAPNLIMLAVFGGMLLAGILSWDKEAPDALRSIGVLPALIYFSILAVVAGVAALRGLFVILLPRRFERLGVLAMIAVGALAFGWIAQNDLDTYFNRQMRNTDVWAAHDIGATWIGREMARLGSGYDFRIVPVYYGRPTIEYYAPNDQPRLWQDDDHLSEVAQVDRPLVLFLDYWHRAAVDEARRIDPAVAVRELTPPWGGPTYVYEVILSLDALRRAPKP